MRTFLALIFAAAAALVVGCTQEPLTKVVVYKDPACGCCSQWVAHMNDNGFAATAQDVSDTVSYKRQYGVTPDLYSCHTALVEGYVIEGHVPAAEVKRLLSERPDLRGLSVPGMPAGSPGMEQGGRKDRFDVVAINRDGTTSVYASYPGN
jgi:hypothetical protein